MKHKAPLVVLSCGALSACVTSMQSAPRSLEFADPRASAGVMAFDDAESALLSAVEAYEKAQDGKRLEAERDAFRAAAPSAVQKPSPSPEALTLEDAARLARFPADAGRLIPLGSLSAIELDEVVGAVALYYQTELGYAEAGPVVTGLLPAPPADVAGVRTLARSTETGLRLVRVAHRRFLSLPSRLWVYGAEVRPEDVVVNEDAEAAQAAAAAALESIAYMRGSVTLADLEAQTIQLSFVSSEAALSALAQLGVTVFRDEALAGKAVSFDELPYVAAMPAPASEEMAIQTGGEAASRDSRGMYSIPSIARSMNNGTVSGATSNLLVLFHPAHPEQLSRTLELLDTLIDVPARQVFIEGMVVEISEEGLDELGIEWQFQSGPVRAILGTTTPGLTTRTLDFLFDDDLDFDETWSARIRALVTENKAEILSRPSVITMDDRQATIRIGTDIPVATSQEGVGGNSNKISFDFRYIPTGILLNVRPRIDAENDYVSMQIDTTVSSTVLGADLEVRDADDVLLASAPTIASRRVQTYARIANNTPFIIGGLVSRQQTVITEKTPLLGDLPLVGALFRSERREDSKREVIIVLTPYVLPEQGRIGRTIPQSEEVFDSFGNQLFRDAYRLREEEVFDLSFLTDDPRLVAARRLANHVVRKNFRLAERSPFRDFTGERLPGEEVLAERMIYEIVKRLEIDARVSDNRLIYFVDDEYAGYQVRFLEEWLMELGDGEDPASFFGQHEGQALFITHVASDEGARAPGEGRAPQVGLVACSSREEWGELLWRMNQPDDRGLLRSTILIHSPDDMERLRRAIALKRIVELNGGEKNLTLERIRVGAMLQMPDLREDEVHVIDRDVGRYFFHTEHYYPAASQIIKRSIEALEDAVRQPEIAPYLEGFGLEQRGVR